MSLINITNRAFGIPAAYLTSPIATRILADANILHWYRADQAGLSVAAVNTLTDLKSAVTLTATGGARPTSVAAQFGAEPGISFDGADRIFSATNFNAEADHTLVWIGFVPAVPAGTQAAISIRTDASNQSGILFNEVSGADRIRFQIGAQVTDLPYVAGARVLAIASVSGSVGKLWVNGKRAPDLTLTAGGGANAPICLGSLTTASATGGLTGTMHDVLIFNSDKLTDAAWLQMMMAYAARLGVVF